MCPGPLVTLALFVVGANAQCSTVASGATASALGTAVQGSTAAVTYAFAGETATANGVFCVGCAKYSSGETAGTGGNWYGTPSDVSQGTTAPQAGFFCPSDGSSCSSVASGATASAAGKFYKSSAITAGTQAGETGVLCPSSNQGTCSVNTCSVANTGTSASCLGTACVGSTGACVAVINGYTAPSNGIYCSGCAFKKSGTTAEIAGTWWVVGDVTSGGTASTNGIFCPSDGTSCSTIATGATASSAGKFYSYSSITAGAVASQDGVLCPPATTAPTTAPTVSNSAGKRSPVPLPCALSHAFVSAHVSVGILSACLAVMARWIA